MKRIILAVCFAMGAFLLNAQKIYFVYLQTDSGEPFFVRMDDKLYTSTASGYLILPRLKDSTYNFKLGFPGKNIDLDFSTSINKRDHGYLVKNFGEKGWGLFDLQTLSIQMSPSNVKSAAGINNNSNAPVNAFTDMLAKAADDPSLKQNLILVKEEEKKPEIVQTAQKEEKKPEVTEAVVKEEKKSETITPINRIEEKKADSVAANVQKIDTTAQASIVKPEETYRKSQVIKISGVATAGGFESVFVDEYQNGNKDTVRILIPGDNKEVIMKEESKPDSTKETKKFLEISTDTAHVINKSQSEVKKEEQKKWWPFNKNKDSETSKIDEKKKPETKKTGIFGKNRNETNAKPKPQSEAKTGEPKKLGLFNNKNKTATTGTKTCRAVAGNDDFLKLRRRMAAKTNDDGMLEEASKYFKEKCFTTEQIKNLSSMFLSNAGKYNFFDAAHGYVSDKENFSSLQTELKDEYYVNRFKTLLGN